MNIISTTFIAFFTVFFCFYWSLKDRKKLQNTLLLVTNYTFYSLISWKFCVLLLFTSLTSYFTGLRVENEEKGNKKCFLILNILLNIGILFLFKYYDFFITEFAGLLGASSDQLVLNLLLPVGISFYTFTAIGYTIDVYKKKVVAVRDLVPFLGFISFFPLLMSGPIERSTGLMQQILSGRKFDTNLAFDGFMQIMWGVFKKAVIADNCVMVVNNAFGNYENLPASSLAIGAVLYTLQIYFDFSGYSDMAIGLSKMLGFNVRRNFHYPYFALNVSDFWRRWHMSLQSWFTDYIYIPIGGSRCSKWRTIYNTFVVFVVCGIWHGANWTFVVWGVYHAILFVPIILFCTKEFRKATVNETSILPSIKEMCLMGINFILITIGWIIFNSSNLSVAVGYLKGLMSSTIIALPTGIGVADYIYIYLLIILILILEWCMRNKEYALQFKSPAVVKALIVYIIIAHIIFCDAAQSDFIYYQF